MDYEDLLMNLTSLAAPPQSRLAGYFTSGVVSRLFKSFALFHTFPVPLGRPYPVRAFEVKKISGDLDRLFRMGLLKRKRVKRLFRTKAGKPFGRGYMYMYKITRQGMRYGVYLAANYGVSREERKKKRCEGPWMDDEAKVEVMARSNAPVEAVGVIVEERKQKLHSGKALRRFPVVFDDGLYTWYLAARLEHKKAKAGLKQYMSEVDKAKFEAQLYKQYKEIDEQQTPLASVILAKDVIEKSYNPVISEQGARELAALGLAGGKNHANVRVSHAFHWIIREMMRSGFKLSKQ
jgi:hypothetical protein